MARDITGPIRNALKRTPQPGITPGTVTGQPSAAETRARAAANIAKMQEQLKKVNQGTSNVSNQSKKKKNVNTNNNSSTGMTLPSTVERSSVFTSTGGGSSTRTATSSTPAYTPPDVIVRIPERDVVNYQDEDIPTELITNLLFENLGANELIKFERHDTVEGTNANYDIISNLSNIRKEFNPATLISRQKPDTSYFDIFNIKLEDKIPTELYLRNNPKIDATGNVNTTDYVYIDEVGNLVIELVNIESDEILEVEIDSNGTIYEVTL